jgi:basic membrane protein A
MMAAAAGWNHMATGGTVRVAVVTPDKAGDHGFIDGSIAGLDAAKTKLGIDTKAFIGVPGQYYDILNLAAQGHYDMTIAMGFLFSKDLTTIARANPRQKFAIVDGFLPEPNVTNVNFKEQDGSFLAGALAALMTKTKKVGFEGSLDVYLLHKFEAGFRAGVEQIDPSVKVEVKYTGSFTDPAAGKEVASVLFNDGDDIVFAPADHSALGAVEEVKTRPNCYLIGADFAIDDLAKGKILTTVQKHVDLAIYELAKRTQEGRIEAIDMRGGLRMPTPIFLGLKENGMELTDFPYSKDVVGQANIDKIHQFREDIIAGKIVPPDSREKLASFKPVKL